MSFSVNIVLKVLRRTALLTSLTFNLVLLSLKPLTFYGDLEFYIVFITMQGVESQTLQVNIGVHHLQASLKFIVLLVSGRYVDGAGDFTYCHFWAHHAALGRCQDN